MKTFAQTIIDTAHGIKKSKLRHNFVGALSTGISSLANDIQNAMRFSLTHDVGDALAKMDKTPVDTLIKAYPYAKLPYPATWIEYQPRNNGCYHGWFFQEHDQGIRLKPSVSLNGLGHIPVNVADTDYLINEDGFHYLKEPSPKFLQHFGNASRDRACKTALSLLLLMNSRSSLLKMIENDQDFSRLNKSRLRMKRPIKISNHTITFDIARILSKNPNISDNDANLVMSAALVRGHFKVRKTGVFFWSPYVRNAHTEKDKQNVISQSLSNSRIIKKTGPSQLPRPR